MVQVCSALWAAAQRTPEAEEQEAVSNLVTVVDFQLSLPPLDSEDDEGAAAAAASVTFSPHVLLSSNNIDTGK